ncbi:autotransporter assembly complex protein TamA, partial [Rubrivirga sp.]|uniref:autotransporter assembly complex protein TamA n=1 Tax=Rubrivirga sp. TaxID=1885344 RepID=UPI003C726854
NGTQASEIRPGTEVPDNSSVTVRVTPGDRYRFGTTDIVNAAPPTLDPDDQVDGPESVGFSTGEFAEATAVRAAGRLAVRAWRQQGYAKAAVADRDANAVHPDDQFNVTIRMEPGQRAAYGEISVEGTEFMNPAFVSYMTGLTPGEEYDPDTLARARKRLERLGVFSLQRLQEADEIGNNGLLPINVLVKERKLRRIGVGATFSSIDGAGAEAFWLHRNLFGQAESLRLSAEVGGVGGGAQVDAVDELDYEVAATFKKPGLLDPDTDFIANAFARAAYNDTFSEKSVGASAGLTRYQTENITLAAEGFVKYGEYEDVFGTRRFGVVGAQATGEYDLRDNELDPTEGLYFSALARPFYEWEFGNAAARFETEARGYLSPGDEGRTVFAARLKVGTLLGPSIEETPPDQLFLAGGGGSVRGYGFKNIGIKQADGNVTGGQSLVEGAIEVRQRFGASFGAVAFADFGMVGEESFSGFDTDPKVGVGVGFRYYSGLGPIRLDVAIPLNAEEGDPDFAFYAGIGHAF